MKGYEKMLSYLSNIILRPHREIYSIQKLGPNKTVVKSNEKAVSFLKSISKNQNHQPKSPDQKFCEYIQVNRHQVTIKSEGKSIQVSIYQPQLTKIQKKTNASEFNQDQFGNKSNNSQNKTQCKEISNSSYQNCVIFLHANSGSRVQGKQYSNHVLQYRTLCVSFDYSGSGISQGDYTTMGVNQSKDLSAVIHYVAQKYNVMKFSLWGRSMGAVTGIYYLLTKYKQDVKKIRVTSCIIDSPFSNLQKLTLEIASKKALIIEWIFKQILSEIEKQIISKIGINIFEQLNLVQKIDKLSPDYKKLLNSVSFLGLASKDDKMIDPYHCQTLCELLISRQARESSLIDKKYLSTNQTNDKHIMMLLNFKRDINTKGDFIQIEGDHNKPRTNQVKQKIAFFIEDNFINYNDPFNFMFSSQTLIKQNQKPLSFGKTGSTVKGKLTSLKGFQSNGMKSRKDSHNQKTTIYEIQSSSSEMASLANQQQERTQQPIPGQNYNLINLKDIKAKQQSKQSLSKEKQSIRNSLNKNFLLKQRRQHKQMNSSLETGGKGLNLVSKEFNKEKQKQNQQSQNQLKTSFQTLQSSRNYNEAKRAKIYEPSPFLTLLNKIKATQNTPKQKEQNNTSIEFSSIQSYTISEQNGSVNNSQKKENSAISGDSCKQPQIVISSLPLSQHNLPSYQPPHLTQRVTRPQKSFESLPSERCRNILTQNYTYKDKLQYSPGISTSPFDLSVGNCSSMQFEVQNQSFRKKQTSQVLDAQDLSPKKQTPKTPQVKISISDFRNKQEQESSKKSINKKNAVVIKKQNSFGDANLSTNWTLGVNQTKSSQPVRQEDRISGKQSLQFRKRQPASTNSIHSSVISYEEEVENNSRGYNYDQNGHHNRQQQSINHVQVNLNKQKHPNVSNSFTENGQNSIMRQMMMSIGHKGMTQSSTFNYGNQGYGFYSHQQQQSQSYQQQPQLQSQQQYHQFVQGQQQVVQMSSIGVQQEQKMMVHHENKPQSSAAYYMRNGQAQSMRTSQDQYNHMIVNNPTNTNLYNRNHHLSSSNSQLMSTNNNSSGQYIESGQTNNIFMSNKGTSQSATYGTNTSMNSNTYYYNTNSNQVAKQQIEYKTRITRLPLD